MINKKAQSYGGSGSAIRELFEYGKQRRLIIGNENVFDFSIGNPSTPTPKEFNDALVKALTERDSVSLHGYTSAVGNLEAREAIQNQLNEKYNAGADKDYIYLTCGAAAGLTISLKALISNKEDEAIVFAPFFAEYSVFIENAGMKKVICKCDENMIPDLKDLESKITSHTKVLIIDSPNNPTGVVYGEEVIKGIADLLKRKQEEYGNDIYLLSDEPYRELIFSEKKYPFVTRYYDNSIVTYSFSKSLSLPGERIGYILLNPRMNNVKEVYDAVKGAGRLMGYVCAPSLFQAVVPLAVSLTSDFTDYIVNRDLLYKGLTELGYEVIYPEGAFYMFVKALEEDDEKFSLKAREFDLLLVPSSSFGIKGYVRLAYCCSTEQIKRSMPAFKALKESYDRRK